MEGIGREEKVSGVEEEIVDVYMWKPAEWIQRAKSANR